MRSMRTFLVDKSISDGVQGTPFVVGIKSAAAYRALKFITNEIPPFSGGRLPRVPQS
jgi:hypothetical protein